MGSLDSYILKNRTPYPVTYLQFARWRTPDRVRIALTQMPNELISTVFLGLDYQFQAGLPPILFETMIFDGHLDGYQCRYNTYEQAVAGHRRAVKICRFLMRLKRYPSLK